MNTINPKEIVTLLKKEWDEYKKDPEVYNDPNPPLGIVFTFEGFWFWLLEKYSN